eukprot:3201037-Pleurochrysis_carterae.AAC.1
MKPCDTRRESCYAHNRHRQAQMRLRELDDSTVSISSLAVRSGGLYVCQQRVYKSLGATPPRVLEA